MKKVTAFAAILGTITLISSAFVVPAQAQSAAAPKTSAIHTAVDAAVKKAPSDVDTFAKDSDECMTKSSASSTEGDEPSEDVVNDNYKKCMIGKGYTAAQIEKHEQENEDKQAPEDDDNSSENGSE